MTDRVVISKGETLSGYTFSAFVSGDVRSGGKVESSTVLAGGVLVDGVGGRISAITDSGMVFVSGTAHALTVVAGGTVAIGENGQARDDVVRFGGVEIDSAYNQAFVASHTTISNGGAQIAEANEAASGTIVSSGGVLRVEGGVSGMQLLSGGQAIVEGTLTGTVAAGGMLVLLEPYPGGYSTLSGLVAQSGASVVLLGDAAQHGLILRPGASETHKDAGLFQMNGAADLLISAADRFSGLSLGSGESLLVYSGGVARDLTVGSGATITLSAGAVASGGVFSGGDEFLSSGAVAEGGVFEAGGTQRVANAHANNAVISSGGVQSAAYTSDTQIYAGGVEYGGEATSTIVHSGGLLAEIGVARDTTVQTGGAMAIEPSFVLNVLGATVARGAQLVVEPPVSGQYGSGTLSAVTIAAGATLAIGTSMQLIDVSVASGGAVFVLGSATTMQGVTLAAGAVAHHDLVAVLSAMDGATLVPVLVSAMSSHMSGARIGAGETQFVWAGGVANGTTVTAGGVQSAFGGTTDHSLLAGGSEFVSGGGAASATTIGSGGVQNLFYATASATMVAAGGTQDVGFHASAVGDTVASGGLVVGGAISDTTLAAGGTLDMGFEYSSGARATLDSHSDVLTIRESGQVYQLTLAGSYAGETFHLSEDAYGGTLITLSAAAAARGELLPVRGVVASAAAEPALGMGRDPQAPTTEPMFHLGVHQS